MLYDIVIGSFGMYASVSRFVSCGLFIFLFFADLDWQVAVLRKYPRIITIDEFPSNTLYTSVKYKLSNQRRLIKQ